mgnify:CR=1 FL=1
MESTTNIRTWYGALATRFGLGRFSKMPGTLGTLAAFLILLLMGGVNIYLLAAVIIIGTIAADRYAKAEKLDDPSEVIIDEVAGYWTAMLGLDPSYAIIAFFLFRIIDILKPFPVRNMEKLPGGIGIMADDICGGALVNLLMRLIFWLFFAGGFNVIYGFFGAGS